MRRLLEAWCTPAVLHGRYAGLKRLRIYTPHAEFPASELEESWANMRITDGERILEVSIRESIETYGERCRDSCILERISWHVYQVLHLKNAAPLDAVANANL